MLAGWMDVQIYCHHIQNRNRTPNHATLGQIVSVSKPGALVAMSVSRMKFLLQCLKTSQKQSENMLVFIVMSLNLMIFCHQLSSNFVCTNHRLNNNKVLSLWYQYNTIQVIWTSESNLKPSLTKMGR